MDSFFGRSCYERYIRSCYMLGKILQRYSSIPATLLKRKPISRLLQQFCLEYNKIIRTLYLTVLVNLFLVSSRSQMIYKIQVFLTNQKQSTKVMQNINLNYKNIENINYRKITYTKIQENMNNVKILLEYVKIMLK